MAPLPSQQQAGVSNVESTISLRAHKGPAAMDWDSEGGEGIRAGSDGILCVPKYIWFMNDHHGRVAKDVRRLDVCRFHLTGRSVPCVCSVLARMIKRNALIDSCKS
jgi:hypothetical protein